MSCRKPAAVGTFYPADRAALRSEIDASFARGPGVTPGASSNRRLIVAGIASNAGLWYCGPVSAFLYKELKEDGIPETFVILGPNILYAREGWFLYPPGTWETPLGVATIDAELTTEIAHTSRLIAMDAAAHEKQHTVELQLLFLQHLYGNVRFVPIITGFEFSSGREVGLAIAQAARRLRRDVVVLASSTGSHFLDFGKIRPADRRALAAVLIASVFPEALAPSRTGWSGSARDRRPKGHFACLAQCGCRPDPKVLASTCRSRGYLVAVRARVRRGGHIGCRFETALIEVEVVHGW